jgi:hypothetical protein
MQLSYWVRRTHKWIGLVIGVQALLWMISGVYMTVVPLDIIHGDHLAHVSSDPLDHAAKRIDHRSLMSQYPGITSFRLKQMLGKDVFEIRQGKTITLVDAATGTAISPLKEETVRALADAMYTGEAGIKKIEWVTQAPGEVGKRPVPMWAVHYAEWNETTLYFSPYSGELLARRHSLWRWFDFVWMLHIMDYGTRSDVNNTLLRIASATGLLFALSGVWLLFYSFRRRISK